MNVLFYGRLLIINRQCLFEVAQLQIGNFIAEGYLQIPPTLLSQFTTVQTAYYFYLHFVQIAFFTIYTEYSKNIEMLFGP